MLAASLLLLAEATRAGRLAPSQTVPADTDCRSAVIVIFGVFKHYFTFTIILIAILPIPYHNYLVFRFWSAAPSPDSPPSPVPARAVFYWWDAGSRACLPCRRCVGEEHTLQPCTKYRDTQCGSRHQVNMTGEEEEEGEEDLHEGVLVFEARDQVEKVPPAFGTPKHEESGAEVERSSSTRDVHMQRVSEEFEAAGLKYQTDGSSAAPFGRPKFYTDETDDESSQSPREKHLENVVKKFLREDNNGAENATDKEVEQNEDITANTVGAGHNSEDEAPVAPSSMQPSTDQVLTKNAFRQIFKMIKDDYERMEEAPEARRSKESEFAKHKLLITLGFLILFLAVACLVMVTQDQPKGPLGQQQGHGHPARASLPQTCGRGKGAKLLPKYHCLHYKGIGKGG